MTTFNDMLFSLGGLPTALGNVPFSNQSKVYFVDAVRGSASGAGTFDSPLSTVSAAEDLCVSGQHDTVVLLASASGVSETAAITWDKNLTHLIGVGAPSHIAQRSRIVVGAVDLNPFLTVSGYGCMFSNIQIQSLQADADSKLMVTISGQRNYFENVHFNGGGHATQAVDGGASVKIDGGDENLFRHCVFGVDTAVAGAGYANLLFDSEATRNKFEDCLFQMYAGATSCVHVEIIDLTGIDRWTIFERCMFVNDCRSYSLASAFTIPGSMGAVTNFLLMKDCLLIGSDDWDKDNRGIMYLSGGTATAGGYTGLFQASNAT